MPINHEELSAMSGESSFKKPTALVLDQISVNGGKGSFEKDLFTKPKDSVTGKYLSQPVEAPVEVVFLKIRRKLIQFEKGRGLVRSTSEHNVPSDKVMMFGDNSKKGVAKELRDEFPGLRTQQIVYAIEKKTGEIVKVLIKGASLGSENKAKETPGFYDYLKNFKDDDHMYNFVTVLKSVGEKSTLGEYFCMTFERGDRLTDAQMEKVATAMRDVHSSLKAFDDFYANRDEKEIKKVVEASDNVETIEYPDDINPEDIPF